MPDQPQSPSNEPLAPRVTALIVSYNSADALRRSIQALRASQARDQFEILVVDLGSRDDSSHMDSEFDDVTMLRLPKHFGATKAMNIATRTAMGDYIFYLDPHTELRPDALARLMKHLDEDDDASAVCPLLENSTGSPVPQAYRLPDRDLFQEACNKGQMPLAAVRIGDGSEAIPVEYASRSAIMVRKGFVQGMNYFDERYGQFWGDAELAYQIRKAGKKTLILPAARAVWRGETASEPKSKKLDADRWLGASAFLSKHEGFGVGFTFLFAAVLKALFSFDFGLFVPLVSGQKIDGNQGEL